MKAKELHLPYYLPIVEERRVRFMHFPRALAQIEMQTMSSRIWTPVAVSISFGDNNEKKPPKVPSWLIV